MKNLFVIILALLIQSAAAQKVFLSSEMTEKEKITLINKYSGNDNNLTNQQLLSTRVDSTIRTVFPTIPKKGIAVSAEVFVNKEGYVDYVLFDLLYAQKYNRDSLNRKFREAFTLQMSKYKAAIPGIAFMRTFGMSVGRVKAPREVRQMDSSLTDLASLISYKDTLRIKRLFLNDLELKAVPQAIYRYPNLEELYLSQNEIEEVNLDMKKLPGLSQLHLQSNKITSENFRISGNKTLKLLNLNENQLSDIPMQAGNCRRLNILWLGGNDLKKLTNTSFRRLKRVNDLNLYKANIALLPKGIKKMKRLQVLDLYYNNLEMLPNTITKLKKLTHLAVSHNQLGALPDKLYKMKNIHTLYAHHNRLSRLPEKITLLQGMKILDLGYNWFTNFPDQVTAFDKLEELDLSGNNFQEFPSQLLSIKHLNKLYLRGNPFTENRDEAKYNAQLGSLKDKNIEVCY